MSAKRFFIDVNQFYEQGYSATFVISDHYQAINKAVNATEWVEDAEGIYNRVPAWRSGARCGESMSMEGDRAEQTLDRCPEDLVSAIMELLADNRVIGSLAMFYHLKLDFIDLWDGVETKLGWHWDGPDQSSVISIIYLNEPGWKDGEGGEIAVGERSLCDDSNWLVDYRNVREIARIKPAGRNQVWINNSNPRFVHRPFPLANPEKQRVTLTFGCSLVSISQKHGAK